VPLDDHLFRREAGRMVAVLTRIFGVHNLALAEDVVQDAFCRALEVWPFRGVPDNPSAWLMATAKRRAIDVLRRERTARTFAPELGRLLESEWTLVPMIDELLSRASVPDDQLRMMFSCCHPRLPEEAQVALVLNILCGFGVDEIAAAFLTSRAAMHKRIARGKKVLAGSKRLFDLAGEDLPARLSTVHRALYLLFNEGYHGACSETAVRVELCREALRLARLLVDSPFAATPATHALAALMCLHLARLPARVDASGDLHGLQDQDRALWDADLVAEGERLLDRSATGPELTDYHLEAAIAAVHARAARLEDTDWGRIVALYDQLLALRPSPVVALNRAIAVAERDGPEQGLQAIRSIDGVERLAAYPFYEAAIGELELRRGQHGAAGTHFRAAASLARSPMERRFFERRHRACASAAAYDRPDA
jgi:RNA polymerase sigma factor (sigma-70 family)